MNKIIHVIMVILAAWISLGIIFYDVTLGILVFLVTLFFYGVVVYLSKKMEGNLFRFIEYLKSTKGVLTIGLITLLTGYESYLQDKIHIWLLPALMIFSGMAFYWRDTEAARKFSQTFILIGSIYLLFVIFVLEFRRAFDFLIYLLELI